MLTEVLCSDREYVAAGAGFMNAPASGPAYKSLEVQLMIAFGGMPHLEKPIEDEDRVLQRRTYESPSEKNGLTKIEMFNTAEIGTFDRVGLHRAFFGRTLAGARMPSLTYMLVFRNRQEQEEN